MRKSDKYDDQSRSPVKNLTVVLKKTKGLRENNFTIFHL